MSNADVMYTAKFRLSGRIIQIQDIPQKNIPEEFFNIPNNPPKSGIGLEDYSVLLYEGPLDSLKKRFEKVNNDEGKTLIFVYETKTKKGVVRGILIPKGLNLNRVNFF